MKKIALLGENCQIANIADDLSKLDIARGGAGNGMPAEQFTLMPLIGELQFTINGNTFTPTAVCAAYKDKSGKFNFRMISANSFNRSARETAEGENVALTAGLEKEAFLMKPSELIASFKNKSCSVTETKEMLFPTLAAGKQADWSTASLKSAQFREIAEDEKFYAEARKAFDTFVKENDLTDSVKAVESL